MPIIFEVVEPIGGLDQNRPGADLGVGDAYAIGGSAEPDFLLVGLPFLGINVRR